MRPPAAGPAPMERPVPAPPEPGDSTASRRRPSTRLGPLFGHTVPVQEERDAGSSLAGSDVSGPPAPPAYGTAPRVYIDGEGAAATSRRLRLSLALKFSLPVALLILLVIGAWGVVIAGQERQALLNEMIKSGSELVLALSAYGEPLLAAHASADPRWPISRGFLSEEEYRLRSGGEEDFDIAGLALLDGFLLVPGGPGTGVSPEILEVEIRDADGRFVAGAHPFVSGSDNTDLPDFEFRGTWTHAPLDTVRIGGITVPLAPLGVQVTPGHLVRGEERQKALIFTRDIEGAVPGRAILALSAEAIERELRKLHAHIALVCILAIALAIASCILVAHRVTRHAKRLIDDMTIVAAGDLTHETSVSASDEIGQIGQEFNKMTRSLRLARHAERQAMRFEDEIDLAREIQVKLLPVRVPRVAGFDIDAVYQPAREVGGDYYDFFPIDDGGRHMGIVAADVSGKGIPGSMIMASTRMVLRFVASGTLSAAETLSRTNAIINHDIKRGMFVTAFYVLLDVAERSILCASAGHNPMIIARAAGGVELVNPGGIALGFDKGPLFERTIAEQRVDLAPGDRVVLYTDGIVEAMNERHEEYSPERFHRFVAGHAALDSRAFIEALLADVEAHKGGAEATDDITIVTFKVD